MFIHIIERKATARLFEGSIFSHTQKTYYPPPKQKILQVTARLLGGRTFSHKLKNILSQPPPPQKKHTGHGTPLWRQNL